MFDMKSKYACFILSYKHFQWKVNSIKKLYEFLKCYIKIFLHIYVMALKHRRLNRVEQKSDLIKIPRFLNQLIVLIPFQSVHLNVSQKWSDDEYTRQSQSSVAVKIFN